MSPDELRERQSNRHKGKAWLRARGLKAGRASGIARFKRIALKAYRYATKGHALMAGYEMGYRAAYKRWGLGNK